MPFLEYLIRMNEQYLERKVIGCIQCLSKISNEWLPFCSKECAEERWELNLKKQVNDLTDI